MGSPLIASWWCLFNFFQVALPKFHCLYGSLGIGTTIFEVAISEGRYWDLTNLSKTRLSWKHMLLVLTKAKSGLVLVVQRPELKLGAS